MRENPAVPDRSGLNFWANLIWTRVCSAWRVLVAPLPTTGKDPREPPPERIDLGEFDRVIRLMAHLNRITRRASVPGRAARETVAEHCYLVASVGLFLVTRYPHLYVGVDPFVYICSLLLHDLPEAFAGDAQWEDDPATKERAEETAVRRLEADYPELAELITFIRRYIDRDGPAANRARSDEKLVATWVIFCSGGASWQATGQTLAITKRVIADKVALTSPTPATIQLMEEMFAVFELHPEVFAPEEV